MSSSTNSSIVWTYFKKVDTRSVSCNLCGKNYKSSGNTTNLATHLKSKHHHAYAQLTIKKKTNVKTATTNNAEENNNNMSLALPTSSKSNTTLTDSNSFSDLVSQVIFFLQYIKQALQYKIKFYNIINLQLCSSINSKYIF